MSGTIVIPSVGGTRSFDRDQLVTAVLIRMDGKDVRGTFLGLREQGIPHADAVVLAVAARICEERGIEP